MEKLTRRRLIVVASVTVAGFMSGCGGGGGTPGKSRTVIDVTQDNHQIEVSQEHDRYITKIDGKGPSHPDDGWIFQIRLANGQLISPADDGDGRSAWEYPVEPSQEVEWQLVRARR